MAPCVRPSTGTVAGVAAMLAAVVSLAAPPEGTQDGSSVRFLQLVNWMSLRWYFSTHCLGAIFLVLMDVTYGFIQSSSSIFASERPNLWFLACTSFWCLVWSFAAPMVHQLFERTVPLTALCLFSAGLQIYILLVKCFLSPDWALKLPSFLISSLARRKSRNHDWKAWLFHELSIFGSSWVDWCLRQEAFRKDHLRAAGCAVGCWLAMQAWSARKNVRLREALRRNGRISYELEYATYTGMVKALLSARKKLEREEHLAETQQIAEFVAIEDEDEVEDCGICYESLAIDLPSLLGTGVPVPQRLRGISAFRQRRCKNGPASNLSCNRLGWTFSSSRSREVRLGRLPCGHVFHWNCLDALSERHKNCPLCRASLKGPPKDFASVVEGMTSKELEDTLYDLIVSPDEGVSNLKRAFIFPICGGLCLMYSFVLPPDVQSGLLVMPVPLLAMVALRLFPEYMFF